MSSDRKLHATDAPHPRDAPGTPSEIKAMTLEMFDAEKAYLKGYR
ncbi:MAG: hypothetical protein ACOVMP_11450 [Chthoniobacterales bacterium]